MTNFDYLTKIPAFEDFAKAAQAAEKIYPIDLASCAASARRAAELALKFLYSIDRSLIKPWQDSFVNLISEDSFRKLAGFDMYKRLDYIRKCGNLAAHTPKKLSPDGVMLSLEYLFAFCDFISYNYAPDCKKQTFNKDLVLKTETDTQTPLQNIEELEDLTLEDLIAKNQTLIDEYTKRREERRASYEEDPLTLSEYKTRKIYIDTDLNTAGWTCGSTWINEVELPGMPNKSGVGYADYVLYADNGKPLAVIEAKKTCVGIEKGKQQAKLYADLLQKKYSCRRPIIFLSNGFETKIWEDEYYPPRHVSGFYSKDDLEKEFYKLENRKPLRHAEINPDIAGRAYQKEAVKAVCESFDTGNRRKALLEMATGSGKTRTIMSLIDVLLKNNWIKNTLFLADRTNLVRQAKSAFTNHMPTLTTVNLCEEKNDITARAVFSTYQTMQGAIDDLRDEKGGRLFTCGHFDLIIVDEAHRSIYKKYKDIFTYFDALLVGLTATPKGEIDKNTYSVFDLAPREPTFGYGLSQAVSEGYLVPYETIEVKSRFMTEGITYDELTDEEREEFEKYFTDEEGQIPDKINAAALNKWLFNEDTVRKVLKTVMEQGQRVEYGSKIGKTIIFAANHKHALFIKEIFDKDYPQYASCKTGDFCDVIDNYANYAQSLIDDFETVNKNPQIAISVDMLDTGIDIPEILNLVFFKKVFSKAKFWQMIGRGTRLCPGLIDGCDKEKFYIFDFCANFEFFRVNKNGRQEAKQTSIQERLFNLKCNIIYKLKGIPNEELKTFRAKLVSDVLKKVRELDRDNFAIRQHIKFIDLYSREEAYLTIEYQDLTCLEEEVAPYILPEAGEASASYFDYLLHGLEYAFIISKQNNRIVKEVKLRMVKLSELSTIPEIVQKLPLINTILHTDCLKNSDVKGLEKIRTELRDLMKYIPPDAIQTYKINFEDEFTDPEHKPPEFDSDDLRTYREKAAFYLREHEKEAVIQKIKTNIPLTADDITELERILWKEIGSEDDYKLEAGSKPLGQFVRELTGLDRKAAEQAFSDFLDETKFNVNQIRFVRLIVDYVCKNGLVSDFSVLNESPFADLGGVNAVFGSNRPAWSGIMKVIKTINANVTEA